MIQPSRRTRGELDPTVEPGVEVAGVELSRPRQELFPSPGRPVPRDRERRGEAEREVQPDERPLLRPRGRRSLPIPPRRRPLEVPAAEPGLHRAAAGRAHHGHDPALLSLPHGFGDEDPLVRGALRVRAHQPGTSRVGEVVVRPAEPVDAVVLQPHPVGPLEPLRVVVAHDLPDVLRAMERRVTDDRVGPGPRDPQGVGGLEARQVLERQGALGEVELVDRELLTHPQGHAGEGDGEGRSRCP